MTDKELFKYVYDHHEEAKEAASMPLCQFMQAKAINDALVADIENGSQTAATDLIIFTIGCEVYPLSCCDADTVSATFEFLHNIMELAVNEIKLAIEEPTA